MKEIRSIFLSVWFVLAQTGALAQGADLAIHSDIVTESGHGPGWIVITDNKITDVLSDSAPQPEAKKTIRFDQGYAFPGLIDTHDHVHWNCIPRWKSPVKWPNRYVWQLDPVYITEVNSPFADGIAKKHEPAAICYGELRAIAGGTTMVQSRFSKEVPEDMLIHQLGKKYHAYSFTADIRKLEKEELALATSPESKRVFLHIAEGKQSDKLTVEEFEILRSLKLLKPGVVVIHGIGLTPANMQEMKKNKMHLVWSPRSNLELYGETTDIKAAIANDLTIALAPDWTITGSNNLLDELKFANQLASNDENLKSILSAQRLFKMVTSDAAVVAGVEETHGKLAKDFAADILLIEKEDPDPYVSLIQSTVNDIALVIIDGAPVYGTTSRLAELGVASTPVDVAGGTKAVINRSLFGEHGSIPEAIVELRKAIPKLAPIYEERDLLKN